MNQYLLAWDKVWERWLHWEAKLQAKEAGGAPRRDPGFEGWLPSSSAAHGSSQMPAREVPPEGS